jgi:multisubunit Na+/H+ antiporter MnhC subunit
VLLGLLLYSEVLTSDVVIGLTVVLGGVILVVSGESRRSRSPQPVPETEVT